MSVLSGRTRLVTAATATLGVTIGLAGLGMVPASANGHPQFSASGPLTFASQALTTTSAVQTETITNLADDDINSIIFGAGAVTLTGANPSDFVIASDTCSGSTIGAGDTCTVQVRFTPTAVGDRAANLHFVFSAQNGVLNPASPQDVALTGTATPAPPVVPQGPVAGCVKTPAKLPESGTRRLTTSGCETNSGAPVKVSASARMRGDIRIYKLIRRANGATFIKTFGVPAKLRITWSAPASPGFSAYKKVKTYRI